MRYQPLNPFFRSYGGPQRYSLFAVMGGGPSHTGSLLQGALAVPFFRCHGGAKPYSLFAVVGELNRTVRSLLCGALAEPLCSTHPSAYLPPSPTHTHTHANTHRRPSSYPFSLCWGALAVQFVRCYGRKNKNTSKIHYNTVQEKRKLQV